MTEKKKKRKKRSDSPWFSLLFSPHSFSFFHLISFSVSVARIERTTKWICIQQRKYDIAKRKQNGQDIDCICVHKRRKYDVEDYYCFCHRDVTRCTNCTCDDCRLRCILVSIEWAREVDRIGAEKSGKKNINTWTLRSLFGCVALFIVVSIVDTFAIASPKSIAVISFWCHQITVYFNRSIDILWRIECYWNETRFMVNRLLDCILHNCRLVVAIEAKLNALNFFPFVDWFCTFCVFNGFFDATTALKSFVGRRFFFLFLILQRWRRDVDYS